MKKKVFISKLYEEYIEQNMKPSEEYLKLAKEFSESVEKLAEGLSEEKNAQLNYMYECMDKMLQKQCKETFIEGFCMGTNLAIEAIDDKK